MKMNRRNVLMGLGTAAAGSGAVFGSGAFTQVEAERNVSIGVKSDTSASVRIESAAAADRDFIDIDDDDSGINFVFDKEDINQNAMLTVGDLEASTVSEDNTDENLAFLIVDDTGFTSDSNGDPDNGIGIEVAITDNQGSLTINFKGSSEDENLTAAASSGGDSNGGTDFTSSELSTEATGTDSARFVLNSSATSVAGVVGAEMILDTSGESGSDTSNVTIRGESIDSVDGST